MARVIEIAEAEIARVDRRRRERHPVSSAWRVEPLRSGCDKEIGNAIAVEVTDGDILDRPCDHIDCLPRRLAAPRNIDIRAMDSDNIGAAVAIEVTEAK